MEKEKANVKHATEYLEQDKLLHIDMLEPLRLKEAELIRAGEDGVLIHHQVANAYMMSAASKEAAKELAGAIPAVSMLVLHQSFLWEELMRRFGLTRQMFCHQAAWLSALPVPESPGADIRPLTLLDLPAVLRHYTNIPDERYIRERIETGMLGIYENGELAGFIGIHEEGSIGMLEILPDHRRRGLAFKLEMAMMRKQQSLGRVPYAQIKAGNEASLRLHQKLGMAVTQAAPLCWLF